MLDVRRVPCGEHRIFVDGRQVGYAVRAQSSKKFILFLYGVYWRTRTGGHNRHGGCTGHRFPTLKAALAKAEEILKEEAPVKEDNILDDVRKGMGVYPFNSPANFLVGDGYYWRSLHDKWPKAELDAAIAKVTAEREKLEQHARMIYEGRA